MAGNCDDLYQISVKQNISLFGAAKIWKRAEKSNLQRLVFKRRSRKFGLLTSILQKKPNLENNHMLFIVIKKVFADVQLNTFQFLRKISTLFEGGKKYIESKDQVNGKNTYRSKLN